MFKTNRCIVALLSAFSLALSGCSKFAFISNSFSENDRENSSIEKEISSDLSSCSSDDSSYQPILLDNYETFVFFTDPHLYPSTNSFEINEEWFENNVPFINEVLKSNPAQFVMCGGDLINDNDTKVQAYYKIKYFVDKLKTEFSDFYIIAGNHDTNYLGDTYISDRNYEACMLRLDELELAMFDGNRSYYSFDTHMTRNYCFNSGIDWDSNEMNDFRVEQLNWFANDLTKNTKPHITLFTHIALYGTRGNKSLSAFMQKIGDVIYAFNERKTVCFEEAEYDFTDAFGHIDFIQAGHEHADVNDFVCGGVPIVITTTFSAPSTATQPTLDCVCVDYDSNQIICKRFGDGNDRIFNISQ